MGNDAVLLRVDMPGTWFEDLDVRFDPPTGCLSYRPEPLKELMAWNDVDASDEDGTPARLEPGAVQDLLLACYAHWRLGGGQPIAAMEVCSAMEMPVRLVARPPASLLHRLRRRICGWLGLLDVYEDAEVVSG